MKRLINSFKYALNGLFTYLLTGGNVYIHISAALIVIVLAGSLRITLVEWCILLLCIGAVIAAEAFNTAIEKLVDLIHPAHHKKAGEVKDIAAAAVLLIAIVSAIIGVLILGKNIIAA